MIRLLEPALTFADQFGPTSRLGVTQAGQAGPFVVRMGAVPKPAVEVPVSHQPKPAKRGKL